MKLIGRRQNLIRRYLLGNLDEKQQQRLEERFLIDHRFKKRVLLVEDELFDDYVLGVLSHDEQQRFSQRLLATPDQIKKLETVKLLKVCATSIDRAALSHTRTPARLSVASRWFNVLLHKRRLIYLPAALALIILLALLPLLVQRLNNPTGDSREERARLEEQLARLNDDQESGGSLPGQPATHEPSVLNVALQTAAVRSMEQHSPVKIPEGTDHVQFELQLMGGDHQSYEATLQTPEGTEMFTIRKLRVATYGGVKVVRLKIPAPLLTDGDYLLKLRDTASGGQSNVIGEYYFRVLHAGGADN